MGWRRSFWMHPQTMRSTNSHHWRYLLIYSNYPISTGEFDTILSGWFTVSHVLLFFACMISLFIPSFWIKVVHLPGIHLQSCRARLQWGRHNSSRSLLSIVAHDIPLHHHIGGFLKQGYLQIIYFRLGFSIRNHPFWGTTIYGNPHIATFLLVKFLFLLTHLVIELEFRSVMCLGFAVAVATKGQKTTPKMWFNHNVVGIYSL